ncbi:hypothetical protein KVH27_35380 [Streptomyces olivaceus]|uniref:hypothetical protein n=1 Tax=Streptomyces olivaceus TaxID=47716 RepID=UPI001CD0205F|nr:hypothetical protein [Streptomyces olivaceus]MBZ6253635.1 hypothetical protein [Streptomyces olivaceus]
MPGITTPLRERKSRRPTCLPNPPMMLLVGPEKSGKSYEAAAGSGSNLIGMTYWIEIGGSEGTADYYGRVPGARYEIVEHNGTYQDILDAIRWAVAQPPVNGKPNMIVVDNVSVLWDMLSDEQALYARRRAERNAQRDRRRGPSLNDPVVVDPDLWNRAKDRWGEVLWMLRRHSGPTLLLARQEVVTAFENDKPTRDKTRKIKAERNLPAAVDAIVELHAFGEAHLTGVRTLHWDVKPGQSMPFSDFSVDTLLRRLGFEEAAAARQVTETRPEAYLQEQDQQQAPARQQQDPARQGNAPQGLTGKQAVKLIHRALTDENTPLECLRALREEWGVRTLRAIPTETKMWGQTNADDLITKSLNFIEEQARKRAEEEEKGAEDGSGGENPRTTTPPATVEPEQAREHHEAPPAESAPAQPEQDPPAEDTPPPPPDPQAEEPPPAESPEDTSAAEEPQDRPQHSPEKPAPRKRRKDPMEIARQGLLEEAEIQARLKFTTARDHLQPIYEDGEPGLSKLRDYVKAQRAEAIALLEENDQPALADTYRRAPVPDLDLKKKFAPYFDSAPAGQ